jgi:hypothetical protein
VKTALSSGVALAVATSPITATAQQPWETASADFANICVASLLAQKELSAALAERGMAEQTQTLAPLGWDGTVYMAADGTRNVTVTRQRYSDLKISNCITSASKTASRDELTSLRRQLEAHPRVGKLEEQIVEGSPAIKIVALKRPGNAPIITFNLTATSSVTTLSMNRWDLQRGK